MSGGGISEGVVEQAALDWSAPWATRPCPARSARPAARRPERASYDHVVLTGRLRDAALRINAGLPTGVAERAVTRLLRAESQNALAENERVHRLLTGGVPVEHGTATGEVRTALVVISDGTSAAMGSFTAAWEHYAPWKTIDGREVVTDRPALEVLLRGVFDQRRFLAQAELFAAHG